MSRRQSLPTSIDTTLEGVVDLPKVKEIFMPNAANPEKLITKFMRKNHLRYEKEKDRRKPPYLRPSRGFPLWEWTVTEALTEG